ncbi:serine/threonine-protein kinase [Streptomyces sp. O3]
MQELTGADPRQAGSYRLLARLGAGGMGTVYLGRTRGGRFVAVKMIHANLAAADGFRERFTREVRTCQRLTGPGTVRVVDAAPDAPMPWLATDYIPGPSLRAAVTEAVPLRAEAAWHMIGDLAAALEHVHAQGLVHRDIKPENILLSARGPLLIDFGIARAVDGTNLTTTGMAIGTPGCMAPEQAQGGKAGPPADVFALGAVTVFALTGRHAFGTGTPADMIYRSVYEPPQLDGIPDEFTTLIEACLTKDPAGRPTVTDIVATAHSHHGAWPPTAVGAQISRRAEYLLNWDTPAPTTRSTSPGGPGDAKPILERNATPGARLQKRAQWEAANRKAAREGAEQAVREAKGRKASIRKSGAFAFAAFAAIVVSAGVIAAVKTGGAEPDAEACEVLHKANRQYTTVSAYAYAHSADSYTGQARTAWRKAEDPELKDALLENVNAHQSLARNQRMGTRDWDQPVNKAIFDNAVYARNNAAAACGASGTRDASSSALP